MIISKIYNIALHYKPFVDALFNSCQKYVFRNIDYVNCYFYIKEKTLLMIFPLLTCAHISKLPSLISRHNEEPVSNIDVPGIA